MTDPNEAIVDKVVWILQKVGINLGTGDPAQIQQKSEDLRRYAEQIREGYAEMNTDLARLNESWSGQAADAHTEAWSNQMKLADKLAEGADGMADALDQHAEDATRIVRIIFGLALELLEMWLIAMVLSAITGFIADLIFATRAAIIIARIYSLFSKLAKLITKVTAVMATWGALAEKVAKYLRTLLVEYVPDGIKEYPINLAATVGSVKLSGRDDLTVVDLLGPMAIGVVQYGGLNLAGEVLEGEVNAVRKFKQWVEGSKDEVPEPGPPTLPMPDSGKPLPESVIAGSSSFPELEKVWAPELKEMYEREFKLTSEPAAPRDPVPDEYQLPKLDLSSRSLADEMAEATRSPWLQTHLEREFKLTEKPTDPPAPTEPVPDIVYKPKTWRQLAYVFLKETLVNGTQNTLLTFENLRPGSNQAQTDNADSLALAWISAPLGGARKVLLQKYLMPQAYQGKPGQAPFEERMMGEMIMRSLAYTLRNTVRDVVQDAYKGNPISTQLTPQHSPDTKETGTGQDGEPPITLQVT